LIKYLTVKMRINNNVKFLSSILLYNSMCNALNIQSPCTYNQCLGICVSFTRTGLFYLATMSKESGTKWQHQSHLARTLNIPFSGEWVLGEKVGPRRTCVGCLGVERTSHGRTLTQRYTHTAAGSDK